MEEGDRAAAGERFVSAPPRFPFESPFDQRAFRFLRMPHCLPHLPLLPFAPFASPGPSPLPPFVLQPFYLSHGCLPSRAVCGRRADLWIHMGAGAQPCVVCNGCEDAWIGRVVCAADVVSCMRPMPVHGCRREWMDAALARRRVERKRRAREVAFFADGGEQGTPHRPRMDFWGVLALTFDRLGRGRGRW